MSAVTKALRWRVVALAAVTVWVGAALVGTVGCTTSPDDAFSTATATSQAPSADAGEVSPHLEAAVDAYVDYVRAEALALADKTESFADAVIAGEDDAARALYADSRVHWQRISVVAGAVGDLTPRLDLREADLNPQEAWTGWHHLEKILWPPSEGYDVDEATRIALAEQLVEDTQALADLVTAADFTLDPSSLGIGAKELLDGISRTMITGDEEIWSGTDLWDIQASIDGAEAAYQALRPVVEKSDPALAATLDERFGDVNSLLATHGSIADGFPPYATLTDNEVLELSRTIEALAEPLSRLTATSVL